MEGVGGGEWQGRAGTSGRGVGVFVEGSAVVGVVCLCGSIRGLVMGRAFEMFDFREEQVRVLNCCVYGMVDF